jgi:hypothetical protein
MIYDVIWQSVPGVRFISINSWCGTSSFEFKECEEHKADEKIKELIEEGHQVIDER